MHFAALGGVKSKNQIKPASEASEFIDKCLLLMFFPIDIFPFLQFLLKIRLQIICTYLDISLKKWIEFNL